MSELRSAVRWFAVGCALGALAQLVQLWPLGFDPRATLRVGSESPALSVVVSDLGPVPVTEGSGHDGQYYYLIARDPIGLRGHPDLTDDPGYRFRRPLTGWLAGGLGTFPPIVTVWSLTLWEIVGMGLAASGLAALLRLLRARQWAMVGVLGALGLWLSVQLVTPDALAMGLALWGVVASLRSRWGWAVMAFAAGALAKDSYLLFALGTAGFLWFSGQRRHALSVAVVPTGALGIWVLWLAFPLSYGFSTKESFGLPLGGLVAAAEGWLSGGGQPVLALAALVGVVVAVVGLVATRESVLRWLLAPWMLVAVVAAFAIWGDGNNAVRVFAPLWTLGFLAVATRQQVPTAPQTSSLRNLPV